jgi:hypothetical protein
MQDQKEVKDVKAVSSSKNTQPSTEVLSFIDSLLEKRGLKLLVQIIPIKGNRNKCINIKFEKGKATMITSACATASSDDLDKELKSCKDILSELASKGIPVSIK